MHVLGCFKKVEILQYTNAQTVAKYFVAIVIFFFMKPYILAQDVLVVKRRSSAEAPVNSGNLSITQNGSNNPRNVLTTANGRP